MQRGRPKKIIVEDKNDSLQKKEIDLLIELATIVKELDKKIDKLIQIQPVSEKKTEEKLPENEIISNVPVPTEYRKIVDEVLNQKFGIKIEPLSDSPQFIMTVVVPSEYSPITPEEKQMMGADLRSATLSYVDALSKIRIWVEKIYKSFNPEMQSKILFERANPYLK